MLPRPGLRPHVNESAPPMKIVGTKVLGGSRSQPHGGRASHGRLRPPIHGKSDRNRRGHNKKKQQAVRMKMMLHLPHPPLLGLSQLGLPPAWCRRMTLPPPMSSSVLSLTAVPPGLLRVPGQVCLGCTRGGLPVTRSKLQSLRYLIKNTERFLRRVSAIDGRAMRIGTAHIFPDLIPAR